MVIAGIFLLLIAAFIPAPIEQPISGLSIDVSDTRAPWFFLWVQQLLKFGDPFLWGVLTPLLVLLGLSLVPYVLPRARADELGRWLPRGNRIAQVLVLLVIVGVVVLTILASLPTPCR